MTRRRDPRRLVHVRPHVSLPRTSGSPVWMPMRTWMGLDELLGDLGGCGERALRVGKAKKNASPCVSTSTPAEPRTPRATMRRCSASASAYASAPSECSSRVEPSTSVKRKVTVPVGRSSRTRHDHPSVTRGRPVSPDF